MPVSPIADLTYRNYDGPLEPPLYRWWAIAKMSIQLALKKKGFWFWAIFSGYWYIGLVFIFYVVDQFASNFVGGGGNPLANNPAKASATLFSQVVWKDQFLNAFGFSQLLLLFIALLIGAGAIANDNRANALLVYLSKPCSKMDYLIGKWLGIFIPITLISLAPSMVFYFYCLMSYRQYGFLNDPWLVLKLPLMAMVPGVFYASVSLGISSLYKQGRMAGATLAGTYFISYFFTEAMAGLHNNRSGSMVSSLYYCSLDGLQYGMSKIILGTDGSAFFPFIGSRGAVHPVPAPSALPFVLIFLGICSLSVLIAWTKVRAVEVVA